MNQDIVNRIHLQGFHRFSVYYFLIALLALIVLIPFLELIIESKLIEAVLLSLVFMSAVFAVGGRRLTLILALLLVTPALVGTWINHLHPSPLAREFSLVGGIVFAAFIIFHLFRFILTAPSVNGEVLSVAISTYLMLAVVWSLAFILVDRLVPNAYVFSVQTDPPQTMVGFNALYFSFTTLTTVGYGDIIPVSKIARMLAIIEAISGVFYVALLVARLVSAYSKDRPRT